MHVSRTAAVVAAFIIAFAQVPVSFAATTVQSGQMQVNGLVAGSPPADAPEITSPVTGTNSDKKNITIEGDCIVGLIVKVFSNGLFIGSAICQNDGHFTLQADLFENKNDLIARQYDTANQASPDSGTVIIFFLQPGETLPNLPDTPTAPSTQTPNTGQSGGSGGDQQQTPEAIADFALVINYDYTVQGLFAGKSFKLPICFSGGKPPYAISIYWGDGTRADVFSRQDSECFTVEHTYKTPGLKTIVIQVSDANGNKAYLQFVAIVNGDTNAPAVKELFGSAKLIEYWPSVVIPSVIAGTVAGIFLNTTLFRLWRIAKSMYLKHRLKLKK